SGQRVPATIDPAAVKLLPAGRRRHRAVLQHRALFVADLGQWRDFFAGETARLAQHGIDEILAEIAEGTGIDDLFQIRDLLQREAYFLNGCAIHAASPALKVWPA